jgi:uncharacterized protein (DUF427 family)
MVNMTIRKAGGTWTVRAGGAILVESKNALALAEGSYDEVIYFPREDVAMALMDPTEKQTHCPHKGDASYFSLVTKSRTLENAAWSYENPLEGAEAIRDHIAFYASDDVVIEQV